MPEGTNTPQGGGGTFRRNNPVSLPKFFLRTGEAAVIRALTRNDGQDGKIGWADVLLSRNYQWAPIRGAFDDPNIKLPEAPSYRDAVQMGLVGQQVSEEDYINDVLDRNTGIPQGWQQKTQVALYIYVYKVFNLQQRPEPRDGRQATRPPRQSVRLSESLMNFVGRPDKYNGVRYMEEYNNPAYWMKGPDFNNGFSNRLATLTAELGGNLTSRKLLIVRKEGATRGEFRSSDWIIVPCPEGIEELQVDESEPQQRKMVAAYNTLPHIRELFEGTLQWPPEGERSQPVAVPAQVAAPEPQPVYAQPAAPAPVQTPPAAPAEYQQQYQPSTGGDGQPMTGSPVAPPPNVVAPPPPPVAPATPGSGGGLGEFLGM